MARCVPDLFVEDLVQLDENFELVLIPFFLKTMAIGAQEPGDHAGVLGEFHPSTLTAHGFCQPVGNTGVYAP